ncbi:hypothetical protein [Ructibacterium gallinarum]|uniref:Uncharacterized protein n=1 Tax=Ructibacterium gallinarum TaxID=2779355 RepID=A0A9D5M0R1_9FIRM|nr:hypothetical protein [Ructibacterium gallinarum]MBE5040507.1 hypothetical protein [Ructibacterium gallinarum]
MADNEKNNNVIYRCPMCLDRLVDVIIDEDNDGMFRCVKCGFHGDYAELMKEYENFRRRYGLMHTRITLQEQKEM